MSFHNPYHFVPVKENTRRDDLSVEKFKTGSLAHVMHDRYEKETFSGRVNCRLTAKTAFAVGDKHHPDENKIKPTIVEQYKIGGLPAIPASTLRGLISSIVEATTNSALRVLNDETYSYRKQAKGDDILKEIGLVYQLKNGNFALLPLCDFFSRNSSEYVKIKSRYLIDFKTFAFSNNQFYYYNDYLQENDPARIISEQTYDNLKSGKENYRRGILRILEDENRRKEFSESKRCNELFIFCPNDTETFTKPDSKKLIRILPEAVSRFHKLADLRNDEDESLPYHPVGTHRNFSNEGDKLRLKAGDLVYFKTVLIDENKYVSEISFSAIWRDLIGQEEGAAKIKKADTTFDFFREIDNELLPFNENRKQITLAEQMFGFVENNEKSEDSENKKDELSLAGRIYPSAAKIIGIAAANGDIRPIENVKDCYDINPATDDGLTLLKVLASPKPPSPAMYFKSGYIAKNRLNAKQHQPQGRKFYLHNQTNQGRPWESRPDRNKADDKRKLKMLVKPVKQNTVFDFYIDFENLSRLELGALLYALRPNEEFRHKIGLGKPLGLGTVEIEVVELLKIDREKRYSHLGLFEDRYQNINSEIRSLRKDFRSINPDLCDVLETLGNPNNIKAKVHYPKVSGKTDEEENFLWFVANDAPPDKNGNKKIKIDKRDRQILNNNFNLKPVTKDNIEPLEDIPLR